MTFTNPFQTTSQNSHNKKPPSLLKNIFKIFGALFLILLIICIGLGGFLYTKAYKPGLELYSKIEASKTLQEEIKAAIASRDLKLISEELVKVRAQKDSIYNSYQKLALFSSVPRIKEYYQDGNEVFSAANSSLEAAEIVIKAIEPYQDFLGLKGGKAAKIESTEDRIAFLTQSIEGIVPHFDTLEEKLSKIQSSLDKIDPNRYPEEFKGIKIKSNLTLARQLTSEIHQFVKDGKPILTKTPWLLGKDKPRNYLLLFQNDTELRPSGGFWTAYGMLRVDKGKITPLASDDIYSLDAKLKSTIPAPRPIKAYHINVPYWYVRDMNISPDFPTNAKMFIEQYEKVNPDKFDAIVALSTRPLVDLIKVLGRVGVPGWGNFTPDPDKRCDGCPNVLYQMLWIAGRPRNFIEKDRKGFLGPLMHSVLANAMNSPKEKLGPIIQALLENVNQKHILFYFKDSTIQEAALKANIAGSVAQTSKDTDYFHLSDANMSSAKTNLFLKQKIRHEIISKDGKVQHKITVTYTNPSKASNCNLEKGDICLNAPKYRDWFRFYVPTGSTMEKMTGSEVEPLSYAELGKQVFEGFYGNKYPLYAQSSTKTSIQYTSSVPASSNYTLLLQKQPGTKPVEYQLIVNGEEQDPFLWVNDKIVKLAL